MTPQNFKLRIAEFFIALNTVHVHNVALSTAENGINPQPPMHISTIRKLSYLVACLLLSAQGHSLLAATYTWDTSASGGIQGGSGIWQNAAGPTNWTLDGGTSRVVWPSGNTAVFSGTSGGIISLASDVTTTGITFNTTGYTLTSSSATRFTGTVGGDLTIASGVTTTIGNLATLTRAQTLLVTGGGTVQVDTGGELRVGGSGILAVRGATGTSTLHVNGGVVSTANGGMNLASATGENGTLTLTSGSVTITGSLSVVSAGGGALGTVNLNGGVLTVNNVVQGGSTGRTAVFNFNGGLLKSGSSSAAFMTGLTTANVREGGARIQADHAITIGQALLHSGTAAVDGGLVKTGTGTLTLNAANTYTGTTRINAGTLSLDNNNTTTSRLASTTDVTISAGTLLLSQSGITASTNRINNSAAINLSGGTFDLNGLSEGAAGTNGVGALSLLGDSIIDFGSITGANLIQFAGLGTHSVGTTLSILNWEEGVDRLLFAGSMSDFSSLFNQSSILFNGESGYELTSFGSYYEVSAVPEPQTVWSLILGGVIVLAAIRKKARRNT